MLPCLASPRHLGKKNFNQSIKLISMIDHWFPQKAISSSFRSVYKILSNVCHNQAGETRRRQDNAKRNTKHNSLSLFFSGVALFLLWFLVWFLFQVFSHSLLSPSLLLQHSRNFALSFHTHATMMLTRALVLASAMASEISLKVETNWAGNVVYNAEVFTPSSAAEASALVASLDHIRLVGIRHSFNNISQLSADASNPGIISTVSMNNILACDNEKVTGETLPCLALSCLVFSFLVWPCRALPGLALPCRALPGLALPCVLLFCLIMSCIILPYLVFFCLVLPCLLLSCLALTLILTLTNPSLSTPLPPTPIPPFTGKQSAKPSPFFWPCLVLSCLAISCFF